MKGIDVSKWQGNIDWPKVKAAGIDFAIIRVGYATTLDPYYKKNIEEATAAGIECGVYLYSYATTVEKAEKEAAFVLEAIKGYKLTFPVVYDLEDVSQKHLGRETNTDLAVAFLSAIEKAGYYAMLYCNLEWLQNRLDYNRIKKFDLWLAQWTSEPTKDYPIGMWQYTSHGSVPGINGRVDMNIAYKDYPAIIRKYGLNHLKPVPADVHVLEFSPNAYRFEPDIGTPGKLETVSEIVKMRGAHAGINLGFFDLSGKAEHYSLLMKDGKILNPPNFVMECWLTKDNKLVVQDIDKNSQVPLDAQWAVGLSFSLILNGKKDIRNYERFPHYKQREPRTAIGQKENGNLVFVAVDLPGMSADELADYMLSLGCVTAINADGGGSTTMVKDGKIINTPEYGKERKVGSVLLVYPKQPAEKFADLKGHWARNEILDEVEMGLIDGYKDGTFKPDQAPTRAEMVVYARKQREFLIEQILKAMQNERQF